MLGEHSKHVEKLVNHSSSARDLQTFLLFSQHPAWVITTETAHGAVYCLNNRQVAEVVAATSDQPRCPVAVGD